MYAAAGERYGRRCRREGGHNWGERVAISVHDGVCIGGSSDVWVSLGAGYCDIEVYISVEWVCTAV